MEKVLYFSVTEFEEPVLQYSGSSDNNIITLTGDSAKRMYVDIQKKELILTFGSWNQVPDFHKTKLSKICISDQ